MTARQIQIPTAYGSHRGSGKLFRFLGQHRINDHILSVPKPTPSERVIQSMVSIFQK